MSMLRGQEGCGFILGGGGGGGEGTPSHAVQPQQSDRHIWPLERNQRARRNHKGRQMAYASYWLKFLAMIFRQKRLGGRQ